VVQSGVRAADGSSVPEFPPLLQVGWHSPAVAELRRMCVERFPQSATRKRLWERLVRILGRVNELGIRSEFWLDGSFMTEKLDPADLDFLLHLDMATLERLTPPQKELFCAFRDRTLGSECDSHILVTWPPGHDAYEEGELTRAYYHSHWGYSRDLAFMKGIVLYQMPDDQQWAV